MDKNNLPDKIIEATIFSDRALVTRMTEIDAKKGIFDYNFFNLPDNIIEESLRTKGYGDFIILGMDIIDDYLEEYNEEEIKKIKNELYELNLLEIKINNKIKSLDFQKAYLDGLNFENADIIEKNNIEYISLDSWQALIDSYKKNGLHIEKEILDLKTNLRDLQKKKNKISYDLNKITGGKSLKIKNCRITCEIKKTGKIKLLLNYLVYGAKWAPIYDARLNIKKKILELSYYANFSQTTGESWKALKLSFSTADPKSSAFLPDLLPWYIDFYYPPPPPSPKLNKKIMRSMDKKTDKLKELKDGFVDADEMEMPAEMEEAVVSTEEVLSSIIDKNNVVQSDIKSSGLNVVFNAKNQYNVNDDGTQKKAVLIIDDFNVKLQYIIIPRLSENAYLNALIKNDKDYPLLKGLVNVYRDNSYVGESNIDNIAPNEEFKLFLGIDSGIEVKYQLLNKFTQKSGLTSQNTKIIYKYKTTIINYKGTQEEINLFEQIPLSSDKDIKIKIEEKDIFDNPDDRGILKALFIIKPQEKKEIYFSYYVEFPKEKVVYNMD